MHWLYSCVVEKHDLRLVTLAGLICLFACFTTASLLERARQAGNGRVLTWISAAAAVFGSGIWTTHFVAELAYAPGMPVGYDIGLTAVSLVVALAVSFLGMIVTFRYRMWKIGGAVIGIAVGGMHYVGMAAMRVPANFYWHAANVIASLVIGILFAAAAMRVFSRGTTWRHRIGATVLLVLAICGLHFTAMTAVVLQFNPLIDVPEVTLNTPLLAVSVAAVTVLIIALGLSGSIVDGHMARQAVHEAERLRDSEARLRQAMEDLDRVQRVAGIGSMHVDVATRQVTWSAGAGTIFGVDIATVEETSEYVLSFVHPDDRAKVWAAAERSRATGVPALPLEYRIVRPDGTERIVYRQNDLQYDPEGRAIRRIVTFKDITALKGTEARLRQAMDNLDRAQRLSHSGSFSRNLITDHAELSTECYRIFGLDPYGPSPSTEDFLNIVVPEDRAKVMATRDESTRGQAPAPIEYRVRWPNGKIRCIHRITELIRDENGTPIRLVGAICDVTELREAELRQKELERQLLHSQKLEAVGTLAGGVSHELNNALVPIVMLSRMMMEDLPPDSEAREDLEKIVQASQRARGLVRGILAFSRKQDTPKQEVDLVELIHRSLGMLRPTLPATTRINDELNTVPPVLANADELEQVIVNLVTNGVHAIGSAIGAITVGLELAMPEKFGGTDVGKQFVRLWIADTGCGMDARTAARIFEPFFTTKEVGEGTGLGLSVVHGIITGHGGRIEVNSEPGHGTEFSIYLPVTLTPATQALEDAIA